MAGSNSVTATERAYRAIREGILEGSLPPGTMVGEAALATDLGVSRTPVRVALARLQDEGWIVVYPKRGALVQGLGERAIAELADARLTLEAVSVGRASPESSQRLAERLGRSVDEQRAALEARDVRRFIDLSLGFHRGFVEAGGNSVLLELYDRLQDRQRFLLFAAGERLLARCDGIIEEHGVMVEQLRSGEAAAFAETLRGHISEAGALPVAAFPVPTIIESPD